MLSEIEALLPKFRAPAGQRISLDDFSTRFNGSRPNEDDAERLLKQGTEQLSDLQDRLYAQDKYALLVIFQAMDAAGKDSTIKHVMSGINPQGCQVYSFKQPSAEELDHDYLWRSFKALPERGRIGIFNRSYYEEVLVVRVHPELVRRQQLPPELTSDEALRDGLWQQRYRQINHFEEYLNQNGIAVLKFFLHISKEEQKTRFLKRIDEPEKNWKFALGDVHERAHWDEYQRAYEQAIGHTSTDMAPWYVIPADQKWFMRLAVSAAMIHTLERLDLQYPKLSAERLAELGEARRRLESEH